MTLSEEARERLADVVALQPTKNAELGERWGMDSGSDVHAYLEAELSEYYYRDANSLIRATDEAAELVDVEPGITDDDDGRPDRVRLTELEAQAFQALPGPDERTESVVSVLHRIRAQFDVDPEAETVRKALRSLVRSRLAETEKRTVPTFRRAVEVDEVDVDVETTADESEDEGEDESEDEVENESEDQSEDEVEKSVSDGEDILTEMEEEFAGATGAADDG